MNQPSKDQHEYALIYSLRWSWLIVFYDFLLVISGLGPSFKRKIIHATPQDLSHETIADIGCGTGVFIKALAHIYPHSTLYAIDPDKTALQYCRKKMSHSQHNITYINTLAEHIPLPDNSIGVCFTTLVLHHLPTPKKQEMLAEAFRILKPGGRLIITDFGVLRFAFIRYLLIFENQKFLDGNVKGLLPSFLEKAGFVIETQQQIKWSGIYTTVAQKPETAT